MNNIENFIVDWKEPIRNVIKKMDMCGFGFMAVYKETEIYGILTDGDFRRAILNGVSLDDSVYSICNLTYHSLEKGYSESDLENLFREKPIKQIPIISGKKLIDVIFRDDVNRHRNNGKKENIKNPVIIIAGGNGTRLEPFTKIFPKPLLPVSDKTIIELIIDRFREYSINKFYVSVFYKKELIKAYFADKNPDYSLKYIEEDKPLGTAGCLYKLKNHFDKPFFVSNCDILIDDNYQDIITFHKEKNNLITIVSSLQHHTIPYGICEIDEDGFLTNINEKPKMDFLVNTGFYFMEPECLNYIPENSYYDMTNLIDDLMKDNQRVGIYPISDKKWIDIGLLDSYQKLLSSN